MLDFYYKELQLIENIKRLIEEKNKEKNEKEEILNLRIMGKTVRERIEDKKKRHIVDKD